MSVGVGIGVLLAIRFAVLILRFDVIGLRNSSRFPVEGDIDAERNQIRGGKDDVEQEREENDGRDDNRHDHVRRVLDEGKIEGAGQHKIGRVRRYKDSGR